MNRIDDVSVLVVKRDGHIHIWRYRPGEETELLRSIGRMASREDIPFSWYDAAVAAMNIQRGKPWNVK